MVKFNVGIGYATTADRWSHVNRQAKSSQNSKNINRQAKSKKNTNMSNPLDVIVRTMEKAREFMEYDFILGAEGG